MRSPCGVGGLRRKLGGSCKRRGVRPNHFRRAAGGNIRLLSTCNISDVLFLRIISIDLHPCTH